MLCVVLLAVMVPAGKVEEVITEEVTEEAVKELPEGEAELYGDAASSGTWEFVGSSGTWTVQANGCLTGEDRSLCS